MKTFSVLLAVLLSPVTSARAGEPSAEARTYLDTECAKAAKAKKDAPCAGVANATLFAMMMNAKFKVEATKADLGDAIKAHCVKVCEEARK